MELALGLHEVLARLVYEKGRISPLDVDVCFDAPRRDWVGALTKPTVDFHLFGVEENKELRETNLQVNRSSGTPVYKLPPRRFDLRYMVSILTSRVQDEHTLLWRVLSVLLKHSSFPEEILPERLLKAEPPLAAQVQSADDESFFLDVWSGFDVPPRTSLLYVVTAPIDLDVSIQAPLVFTRTARYLNINSPEQPMESTIHIGGTVRDAAGAPVAGAHVAIEGRASAPARSDAEGRFVLVGVPTGTLSLRVSRNGDPPRAMTLTVPSPEYELVLQ
jgi:hypothetical protein